MIIQIISAIKITLSINIHVDENIHNYYIKFYKHKSSCYIFINLNIYTIGYNSAIRFFIQLIFMNLYNYN